jgi:uncharacterized protein YggE
MIPRVTIASDMRLICLFTLFVCAAAAQGIDGVTITVSRPMNITPDQAEFSAVVAVNLDVTQQQVTQALLDLGISNLAVAGVSVGSNNYCYSTSAPDASYFSFQVTFTAAPAALKDISKKLDALRAALPEGFIGIQFAAGLTTSQAAFDAAHQTALPLLLADARAKAQALASASGVRLGALAGVSEFSYYVGGVGTQGGYYYGSPMIATFASGTPYSFSATVKFAVQ